MRELADCMHVELVDALECLLANGLLIVSQEQASKFITLKEILSMVFRLRKSQNVLMGVALVDLWLGEFQSDACLVWLGCNGVASDLWVYWSTRID